MSRAKDFVLKLRDLGQRYENRGCTESVMEDIVLNRALKTVRQLVDGVNMVREQSSDVVSPLELLSDFVARTTGSFYVSFKNKHLTSLSS